MQTHIVPVGFDYDRLIAPLVRDQLDVDRVILLEGAVGSEANVEYSQHLAEKLEKDFRNLLGAETQRFVVEDVYDYDTAFEQAYDLINAELDGEPPSGTDSDELEREDRPPKDGRQCDNGAVWVNISSMPRTVSFAFATAAHSIMVERQSERERIRTYYTVPEKYLETELAEELRKGIDLLSDLQSSGVSDERIDEWVTDARTMIDEFDERGTTIGAKCIGESHIVELPVASFSNVKPFEELILFTLGEHGEFASVSELAQTLARDLNEEYTDSFRSKVIYNVDRLGPGGKGYIEQEEQGKSYRTRLSHIGHLWVRSHADENEM
ncbi:HFX_2341 family transcriptional regulator [Halocatena marina]|uniref:DUF6293 family protein n=1 Tax=Halocatena marina TaxID=2934937 RepID=A0ABD5YIW0_9EURY|nr:DUF6293 family protein [Halocatena marina]